LLAGASAPHGDEGRRSGSPPPASGRRRRHGRHGAAVSRDTELGFDLVVLVGGIERGGGGGSGAVVGSAGKGVAGVGQDLGRRRRLRK
jgi:hypothetical protein